MACVLREAPNSMNMLAPVCGSWSTINRGTSRRSPINPEGRSGLDHVWQGTMMISRQGACNLVLR